MSARRCVTNHRHLDPDGWRVDKSGDAAQYAMLFTCRDCGRRLEQRYEMVTTSSRVPPQHFQLRARGDIREVDERRASA